MRTESPRVLHAALVPIPNHSDTGMGEDRPIKTEPLTTQRGRMNGGKVASEQLVSRAWHSCAAPQAEHLPKHHRVVPIGGTGSSSKLSRHQSHVPVRASVQKHHHHQKKKAYTIWAFQASKLYIHVHGGRHAA